MKRNPPAREVLGVGLLAALLFTGCGPDAAPGDDDSPLPPAQEGHAYLSVVGDANVFVKTGELSTITVKYHDEDGQPLAGEIRFELLGDGKGGHLSATSGTTGAQGTVSVDVVGGDPSAFQIKASAPYASPVAWSVAVSQDPAKKPLVLAGDYQLESQFDIATGLPGTVGTVVNTILDMTDGPTDPATWLIDRALAQITNGTIKSVVNSFRPALDGFVNDAILDLAPDVVTQIVAVGNDLGEVARRFGTVSVLHVVAAAGGPDGEAVASHSLEGFVFTIDGQRHEYSMSELDLGTSKADGVTVTLEGEALVRVGEHRLPVSYGRVLLFALNNVIIPAVDPWAHDLKELLGDLIDCAAVGQAISDYVGIGSPGVYQVACTGALGAAAGFVESKLLSIDGTAAALVVKGEAKPQDVTGDRQVDKLAGGLWEGQMTFGSLGASTLAKPNQKFVGARMP